MKIHHFLTSHPKILYSKLLQIFDFFNIEKFSTENGITVYGFKSVNSNISMHNSVPFIEVFHKFIEKDTAYDQHEPRHWDYVDFCLTPYGYEFLFFILRNDLAYNKQTLSSSLSIFLVEETIKKINYIGFVLNTVNKIKEK